MIYIQEKFLNMILGYVERIGLTNLVKNLKYILGKLENTRFDKHKLHYYNMLKTSVSTEFNVC